MPRTATRKRAVRVEGKAQDILLALETDFYAGAESLQAEVKAMDSKITRFVAYKDFYKKRFAKSDSRSIVGIRSKAVEIMSRCNEMLACQKAAHLAAR